MDAPPPDTDPIPFAVWRLAAVIAFGAFMSGLDASIVNVGLDAIARDLDTDLATVQWVGSAYLVALGVSSAQRSSILKDVPTIAESGLPGFDYNLWVGLFGPAGMPPDLVDKINKDVQRALGSPEIKERLANLGSIPTPLSPAAYEKLIAEETEKWGKVIRDAHITLQ